MQPRDKRASDFIRYHSFPVAGIDPMTASTARAYPRHTHDQYGLGVIDSGGHASWSGRGQVEAGPGSFICVNPGEVHDGRAVGRQARSWRILYFEPVALDAAWSDVLESSRPSFTFAAPVFLDKPLRRLFDVAFSYAAVRASGREGMACETAILKLIARLGLHSTRALKEERGATGCIRRVLERIDADPAAPLALVELAKAVDLSRYQLIRGFARELGMTPHAYIVQQRVALARRLIRANHSLVEVAASAGFYDQSHLTRCFVRQFGVTPRRYVADLA